MNQFEIKQKIAEYVRDTFLKGRTERALHDDDSLMDNELLDSTGVLELVLFIEQTFDVRVEDEEIVPDNLDSVNSLVRFVRRKLGAPVFPT